MKKQSEQDVLTKEQEVQLLKLLIFCLECPWYKRGLYDKEWTLLLKHLEQTSHSLESLLKERLTTLSVERFASENDQQKTLEKIKLNEQLLTIFKN